MNYRRHHAHLLAQTVFAILVLSAMSAHAETPDTADIEADNDTIYTYRNHAGRTVYVNGLNRIPAKHQKGAEAVDLSDISLNTALADDLQQAAEEQLQRMLASPHCASVQKEASLPWWSTVWRNHGHLVIIGFFLLVFAAASPYLIRTIGPPKWGRILIWMLPALAILAIITSVAADTHRAILDVKTAATVCQPERYASTSTSPAAKAQRIHLIEQLRRQVGQAYKSRASSIAKPR